jgi:hypothetical protein
MDGPEVVDSGVLDGADRAFNTGIVHRNVETAESRDSFVDKVANVVFLGNVGPDELCLGAERPQLCDKVLALVVVAAGHDDLGAFTGECHSSSTADTGKGASNENNLSHVSPLAITGNPQIQERCVGCGRLHPHGG